VSWYALLHTLHNVGNYETNFNYFPVRLLPERKNSLPSPNIVNYKLEKIDFSAYPDIDYLLAWGVENKDELSQHFKPISSRGRLVVWERK
jgi:hypothetical protein